MSLKHMLNDDVDDERLAPTHPSLVWSDSGYYDESVSLDFIARLD